LRILDIGESANEILTQEAYGVRGIIPEQVLGVRGW
jgi:hypothetical protein